MVGENTSPGRNLVGEFCFLPSIDPPLIPIDTDHSCALGGVRPTEPSERFGRA